MREEVICESLLGQKEQIDRLGVDGRVPASIKFKYTYFQSKTLVRSVFWEQVPRLNLFKSSVYFNLLSIRRTHSLQHVARFCVWAERSCLCDYFQTFCWCQPKMESLSLNECTFRVSSPKKNDVNGNSRRQLLPIS